MKETYLLLIIISLVALAGTSFIPVEMASAETNPGYVLTWSSLDGGSSVRQATSGYACSGTIAQPDAQAWTSAHYQLNGGFWQEWLDYLKYIFISVILRN
jgi:hypothetical protein